MKPFPALSRFLPVLFAATLVLGGTSCKEFEGATAVVKPNPLEVHADSVEFTAKATLPPNSGIKKGGQYLGALVIDGDGKSYEMAKIAIPKGELTKEQFKQLKKSGGSTSIKVDEPFMEDMDGGMLVAKGKYVRKGKAADLPNYDLAPCCITTSRLVCNDYQLIEASHTYEKQVPITLEAKFQFPQNVAEIQPTEYEKGSIKAINDFFKKQYGANKVALAGYASPEGPFKRNEFLSVERSKVVRDWLIEQMKAGGYTAQLDSNFFSITTTTEDWEGFKANLDRTNYPEDVKRQIIEIISAGYNEDLKERKIMALVGGAREVEFILAPLRRTTVRLEGQSARHSDEEILAFVKDFSAGRKSRAELQKFFEQEELLYAATELEGVSQEDKKKLLQEFAKQYNTDYRSFNNLGVQALRDGLADEAIDYLTQAEKEKSGSPAVLNNLGVAYLMKGENGESIQRLKEAYSASATAETAFNLGVWHERRANYETATGFFDKAGNKPCANYNEGLSQLLDNNLAGAKISLENAIRDDKERAMTYYVMAVLGARSADLTLLTTNLKRAVQLDKLLAEKAPNDLEFRKYWDNTAFITAVTD